ncbi:MAG TPA: hypothetical protein VFL86_07295, partial [Burkholderiaceae bacterium]|nr:hypothetical protein [Burkholderiaceae bacterium]
PTSVLGVFMSAIGSDVSLASQGKNSQPLSQARAALALPQPSAAACEQAQAFNRRIEAAEAARCPHCKFGRWFTVAALPKVEDAAAAVGTSGTPLAARLGCRGPP